jgi:hypothetical protein
MAVATTWCSAAALGAGLEVVVGTLAHRSHVTPLFAAFTVAIPVAVFLVRPGLLITRNEPKQAAATALVIAAALLVLLAALTTLLVAVPQR